MADVAATLNTIQTLQSAFTVIQTLNLTAWRYSQTCHIENGTSHDFIIVGGGTAGSVLANRLSANSSVSVLLVETGGFSPCESEDYPGQFPILPLSSYDYNFYGQNDNRTAQNIREKEKGRSLTAGKMLGGTGSLNHMMYTRGLPGDYDQWAQLLEDDTWKYDNCVPYFKKVEKITDKDLLASSEYTDFFGTDGVIDLTRETNPINSKYFEAFNELGHNIETVTTKLGYAEGHYTIGSGIRHSSSLRYLGMAKDRTNLCISLFTTATKIIIENGKAVGVQVTTSDGSTYVVYANKEVIVSAGTFNSPKLLMLSGIGPKSHLSSKGIDALVDLPVGQNFQDHLAASIMYQMDEFNSASVPDPHKFGMTAQVGTVALNSSQTDPDYQVVNLIIPQGSSGLLLMCVNMFKYSDKICQELYEANKSRSLLWAVIYILAPKSRGQVLLDSADPNKEPLIYPISSSEDADWELLARSLEDYNRVVDTTYFKSVNATLMNFGLCSSESDTNELWNCMALKMSNTLWHYCGTCAMGSVVDSKLRVHGIENLRVVDASAMPGLVSAKILGTVLMLAERATDMILSDWEITV